MAANDLTEINNKLQTLNWLDLAGLPQHVTTIAERDRVVASACNWFCLGRTRPALERFANLVDLKACKASKIKIQCEPSKVRGVLRPLTFIYAQK